MSHTSDGENISTTNGKYSPQNWKCNSCASVRSAAKNHNTASRETKPAKWGPSDFQVSWIEHAIKKAPQRQWTQIFWH